VEEPQCGGSAKAWIPAGNPSCWRRAGVTVGILYGARIVIRDRDWNKDIVYHTRALEREPEPSLCLSLGLALADQRRIDEATTQYSEALRIKPDFPQARHLLSDLMSRVKSPNRAVRAPAER